MTPTPMPPSSLTATVDHWTAQAVMTSGYLLRLYRILGDDRQASIAMQAVGPCGERVQRLGIQAQVAALNILFTAEYPEETVAEENAWQLMIEAHAGLCAFHGLVDDHEVGKSIRGARTKTNKSFRMALRGYRSAFPEEITIPGIQQAIETAARRCADVFSSSVEFASDQEMSDLRRDLQASIIEALLKEAEVEGEKPSQDS